MAISPQELEQLDSFMDGTLSDTEARDLERKLNEDPDFLTEAQVYFKLINTLQQVDPDRKKIKEIVKSITPPPVQLTPMRKINWIPIAAAAAVLALVFVWLFYFDQRTVEPTAGLDSDFEITIVSTGVRSGAIPSAEMEYLNGNFSKAAKMFNDEYANDQDNRLLRYNYAVACFKARNYPEAQAAFKDVAQSNDNLNEDAQFYLALSYFKNHQFKESKSVLDSILKVSDHIKLVDAQNLLKKVEKN